MFNRNKRRAARACAPLPESEADEADVGLLGFRLCHDFINAVVEQRPDVGRVDLGDVALDLLDEFCAGRAHGIP